MTKKKVLSEQSSAEISKTVATAKTALAQVRESLPGLVTYRVEDRRTSVGRFREGEAAALEPVLDIAEAYPGAFTVLADADNGTDAATFETALLRERLQATGALADLAEILETLARDVRDTQLALGEAVRGPVLAAYEIARVLAKHDPKVKSTLARTLDFYAQTRAGKAPKA
jgi:hypothetical protein